MTGIFCVLLQWHGVGVGGNRYWNKNQHRKLTLEHLWRITQWYPTCDQDPSAQPLLFCAILWATPFSSSLTRIKPRWLTGHKTPSYIPTYFLFPSGVQRIVVAELHSFWSTSFLCVSVCVSLDLALLIVCFTEVSMADVRSAVPDGADLRRPQLQRPHCPTIIFRHCQEETAGAPAGRK